MSEHVPTRDLPDVARSQAICSRLEAILHDILTEARGSGIDQHERAWGAIPLANLGVNSVDYLRFMNAVEEQFGIVVPASPTGGLPSSLDDWTEFVRRHTAAKQKSLLVRYFGNLLRICKVTSWMQGFQR
jgi:hypothetical protein